MGAGDDIMATGIARGAKKRGRRIAFGNGRKIIWGPQSAEIFERNPNIAPPGAEGRHDIEWVPFYKGHRTYNYHCRDRWMWNYDFTPTPGEIFFSDEEMKLAYAVDPDTVIIEPNVPSNKSCAVNKQWPRERWQEVATALKKKGLCVAQFCYYGARYQLGGVKQIPTRTFRRGLTLLSGARLFVGHEGGLHHGAAAVGVPAVVIFGGWVPPSVTGYKNHANLSGLLDGEEYCGLLHRCEHCSRALSRITVEEVVASAMKELSRDARKAG